MFYYDLTTSVARTVIRGPALERSEGKGLVFSEVQKKLAPKAVQGP